MEGQKTLQQGCATMITTTFSPELEGKSGRLVKVYEVVDVRIC